MRLVSRRLLLLFAALGFVVAACSGGPPSTIPSLSNAPNGTGSHSVSPGSVVPPPMQVGPRLPASAMTDGSTDQRAQMVAAASRVGKLSLSLSWAYVPAAATQVVYGTDGSLYALSTGPSGPNKSIWHLTAGGWANIPGGASRIEIAPDNSIWAITSLGYLYHYVGSSWIGVGGQSQDIAVDNSGNAYVIAKGVPADNQIWEYTTSGTWHEVPGYGARLASTPDNSLYVITSGGALYDGPSFGSGVGYYLCPGAVLQVTPNSGGAGFYALGYTSNPAGGAYIYQYTPNTPGDCRTGTYQQTNGFGIGIALHGNAMAVVGSNAAIYTTTVPTPTPSPSPTPTAPPSLSPLAGPTYGPGGLNSGGYGPFDVANTFNFPVQHGYYGTGQTVAIVINDTPLMSDVDAYLSYFDVSGSYSRIKTETVNGGGSESSSLGEATLDTETIAGLAPGATIIIYLIPNLDSTDITDAYEQIINDGYASVVSSSFGGCEYAGMSSEDTVLAQGAAHGIAFVAASGDQGNECYAFGSYMPGPEFPASDPNVIGVGGTETYPYPTSSPPDQLANPVVWNDDNCGFDTQCASGGGISGYASPSPAYSPWPIPSFQSGLAGEASGSDRNVPDVAMPAEFTAIYLTGQWELESGTSWAAPQFAAMMAEIFNYCNQTIGASPAIANPVGIPYYVYAKSTANFLAITSGNNQYAGTSPYYSANGSGGYNNETGLGVPNGMDLATTYCPSHVPAAIGRSIVQNVALAQHGAAQATSVDVTPRVTGLSDLGERVSTATTKVQFVIRPTSTIAQDETSVVATLEANGFTIVRRFSNHLVVDAQAPSGTVESFFSTRMHDVAQGTYGTRYTPVANAVIPASINPYIAGITLDDVVTMHAGPHPVARRL